MKQSHKGSRPVTRRIFLKGSAAGVAAFGIAPAFFIPRMPAVPEGFIDIHPNISGLRVVTLRDPKMTTETVPDAPWKKQETLVDADVVAANIDRMACTLAKEKKEKDAWKAIFVKPPKKAFGETIVAIKTNNIARQHTRSAVMAKFCRVLVDVLGVKPENIHIYDSCHGADMLKKTPFTGLPEGCRMESLWGGMVAEVPLPPPWKDGAGKTRCTKSIAAGKVDILIDIALCKGHSTRYGGFTMTMKNHFGTFNPRHGHDREREKNSTDYLLSINKSTEVLGKTGPGGKVLFPRQQLCFVDALWASRKGPGCESSAQPNRFFMGVCSPVLDYLAAVRFRRDEMGWPIEKEVAGRFLSTFGLTPGDLPRGGKMIDVPAA